MSFWWLKAKKFLEPTHIYILYIRQWHFYGATNQGTTLFFTPYTFLETWIITSCFIYSCAGSMNMHDLDKQAIIWKWKHRKRCNVYDCLLKYLRDNNLKHHKLKILLTCLTSRNNFKNIIKPPTPKNHTILIFSNVYCYHVSNFNHGKRFLSLL